VRIPKPFSRRDDVRLASLPLKSEKPHDLPLRRAVATQRAKDSLRECYCQPVSDCNASPS